MTNNHGLASLLEPRAVAVLGASRDPSALGRRIFDAIVSAGYEGSTYAVNPHADLIGAHPCVPSARSLPPGVDLAVIAVPRDLVLSAIDDCAAARIPSVVVITAGIRAAAQSSKIGRAHV